MSNAEDLIVDLWIEAVQKLTVSDFMRAGENSEMYLSDLEMPSERTANEEKELENLIEYDGVDLEPYLAVMNK